MSTPRNVSFAQSELWLNAVLQKFIHVYVEHLVSCTANDAYRSGVSSLIMRSEEALDRVEAGKNCTILLASHQDKLLIYRNDVLCKTEGQPRDLFEMWA